MLAEVVALNECLDMLSWRIQALVLIRLDRGLLDGLIHALDHAAVGAAVVRLGMPFFNATELADAVSRSCPMRSSSDRCP